MAWGHIWEPWDANLYKTHKKWQNLVTKLVIALGHNLTQYPFIGE